MLWHQYISSFFYLVMNSALPEVRKTTRWCSEHSVKSTVMWVPAVGTHATLNLIIRTKCWARMRQRLNWTYPAPSF